MPGREIVVRLVGDSGDLEQALRRSSDVTEDFGRRMEHVGQNVANVGDRMSLGVTAPLALIGNAAIDTATRFEAMGIKAQTVFGDQISVVQSWGEANASAMGLASQEAVGLAANFGDLLIPMGFTREQAALMATDTIGLAGALSEWSGGTRSAADVSEILSSAMLGERDALKGLGISITEAEVQQRLLEQGQQDLTGAALQQAEAIATQQLIMEKSTDAQHAFAEGTNETLRAQNEAKAAMSEAAAVIGATLLPVLADVSGVVADVAGWFADLPEPIRNTALAFGGVAAAAGPVMSVGGRMVEMLGKMKGSSGGGGFAGVASFLTGPWGIALAGAGVALAIFVDAQARAAERADDYRQALEADSGALEENTRALVANRLEMLGMLQAAETLGITTGDLIDAVLGEADARADLNRALQEQRDAVDAVIASEDGATEASAAALGEAIVRNDAINDLARALRDETGAIEAEVAALEREQEALATSTGGAIALREETLHVESALARATVAADDHTAALDVSQRMTAVARAEANTYSEHLDEMQRELDSASAAAGVMQTSLEALTGANINADQAAINYLNSLDALTAGVAENSTTLDLNSQAGRANREAVIAVIEAAGQHVQAVAEQQGSLVGIAPIMEQHRQDLLNVATQAGFTTAEVEALLTQYGLTPASIVTTFSTPGSQQAANEATRFNNAIAAVGTTVARVAGNIGVQLSGQSLFGLAQGGIMENHDAQIAPGGAMRLWAEPETGGEAYIPLAPQKRVRSAAILGRVADKFGMTLLPFAEGGITAEMIAQITALEDMPEALALRPGIGWQAMMQALRVRFPGLALISGYRPGAITATGNPSYHGFGRAVDIPPRMDVNHWIYDNYKAITKELIFSPSGSRQVRNGADHYYTGITRANHWDHNHWAMADGGIVTRPTRALIGEAGPEAVIPLDRMRGGTTVLQIDGAEVARATMARTGFANAQQTVRAWTRRR